MHSFDSLDLHIAFAICADALGLDGVGADAMTRTGQAGSYELSPAARDVLRAAGGDTPPSDGWVEIICVPLVEELCDRVGHSWRGEAGVAAEMVVAERVERLNAIADAAEAGPVHFDLSREPVEMVENRVVSADMAQLV